MLPTLSIRSEAAVAKVAVLALPASSEKPDEAEVVEDIHQERFFSRWLSCTPRFRSRADSLARRRTNSETITFDGDDFGTEGCQNPRGTIFYRYFL